MDEVLDDLLRRAAAANGRDRIEDRDAIAAHGPEAARRLNRYGSRRLRAGSCPTLVTLDYTPFDIATIVDGEGGGVYSPRVLHQWDHARPSAGPVLPRRAADLLGPARTDCSNGASAAMR